MTNRWNWIIGAAVTLGGPGLIQEHLARFTDRSHAGSRWPLQFGEHHRLGPRGTWFGVAISVALVACGGAGTTASRATPTPSASASASPSAALSCPTPSSAAAPTAPPGGLGLYRRPRPAGDETGSQLLLCADGTYVVDIGTSITGRWSYADGKISFTETAGGGCTGMLGTYTWSYDGAHVSLAVVSDHCQARVGDAPLAPYTKSP